MSGGPVFNGDRLYGIVSTGITYRKEEAAMLKPYGTAALLWPLIEMKPFCLTEDSEAITIAGEIAHGRIVTV